MQRNSWKYEVRTKIDVQPRGDLSSSQSDDLILQLSRQALLSAFVACLFVALCLLVFETGA